MNHELTCQMFLSLKHQQRDAQVLVLPLDVVKVGGVFLPLSKTLDGIFIKQAEEMKVRKMF